MRTNMFLALFSVLPMLAMAQQVRLPPAGIPPAVQRDGAMVGQYRDEPDERAAGEKKKVDGEASFATLTATPPKVSITPDMPGRDPFEVSPRLREDGGRSFRLGQQEGMVLSKNLRLRAVVRGPQGGIAKMESGNDVIIVRDGDELNVNDIRYTVTVEADGVLLRGAGAPQYKMLVR